MKVPRRSVLFISCIAAVLLGSAAAGVASAGGLPGGAAGDSHGATSPRDTTGSGAATSDTTRSPASGADTIRTAPVPPDTTGAVPDSAQTASDTIAVNRVMPSSTSYVRGSDADMSIGSSMDLVTRTASGWSIRNSISMDRRKYRGLDMQELNETIGNMARKEVRGLCSFDFSIGDQYSKRTTLGLGRFGKDIVHNNQSAGVNFVLTKPVLGADLTRLAFGASGRKGLNDFKYDRSLAGMMSSTLQYIFNDVLKIGGGYGTTRRRESSEVGSLNFGALPSSSDTVRALLDLGGSARPKILSLDYTRSSGEERRVTPPRGNSLEILDDPSKAKREHIKTSSEALAMSSMLQPLPFLAMALTLGHSVDGQTYAVDTALTKKSKADNVLASLSYRYAQKGELTVDVSSKKTLDDFGPISLSSYREREHSIGAGLTQKIGDSLFVSLKGSGSLKQRFFLKAAQNPRDADYLYYRGEFSFRSAYSRVSAGVRMQTNRYETINIDASVSGDNRVDYQYLVVPQVSVKATNWVTVTQEYTIKIDYTDFTYTANKNYLNRTTQLNTTGSFTISTPLRFVVRHAYYMNDTGSYLSHPDGRRLYTPNNENREHALYFDMNYEPIPAAFALRASADFAIQRVSYLGTRNGRRVVTGHDIFESGGLMVGFSRHKKIASAGEVTLDIGYNRRYGPNITKERKEYWDIDSAVVLNF
jgi:hypothetical protein